MKEPLILYSAITELAYRVAQRFYGERHFLWMSPTFQAETYAPLEYANPPSSTPRIICERMIADVRAKDLHSPLIGQNKVGILNGAQVQRTANVINDKQLAEIQSMVVAASIEHFRPLIVVAPWQKVNKFAELVPSNQSAHLFSVEYRVSSLPRKNFDIMMVGYGL